MIDLIFSSRKSLQLIYSIQKKFEFRIGASVRRTVADKKRVSVKKTKIKRIMKTKTGRITILLQNGPKYLGFRVKLNY
jgi:hypothetical protein